MGKKTAKVTINSEWLNSSAFTNDWQIQIVYTVDSTTNAPTFSAGRTYAMMGKVWSDLTGRQLKFTGGVSRPGYADMGGAVTITLNQGWNDISTQIWHLAGQVPNHVRVQINYGFLLNDGVTFYFDDFRLVDIGPGQ